MDIQLIVYVDLSAKVERWEQDSIVASCNDFTRVLLISGRAKQQLRRWLINQYDRRTTHYRAFAAFVYLAVRDDLDHIEQLVIDQDYTGAKVEGTIKNFLLPLLRRHKPSITAGFIRFRNVAGSRADLFAREAFQKKRKPDRVVQIEELLTILNP
jgi:hypothetical protein